MAGKAIFTRYKMNSIRRMESVLFEESAMIFLSEKLLSSFLFLIDQFCFLYLFFVGMSVFFFFLVFFYSLCLCFFSCLCLSSEWWVRIVANMWVLFPFIVECNRPRLYKQRNFCRVNLDFSILGSGKMHSRNFVIPKRQKRYLCELSLIIHRVTFTFDLADLTLLVNEEKEFCDWSVTVPESSMYYAFM